MNDQLLQFLIAGINMGSIYAAVGLGFMVVYSVTRWSVCLEGILESV